MDSPFRADLSTDTRDFARKLAELLDLRNKRHENTHNRVTTTQELPLR